MKDFSGDTNLLTHQSRSVDSISDSRRLCEVSAVLLTALGKILFMDWLDWKLLFIIVISICWITYVVARSKKIHGIKRYWGFRTDNFREVAIMIVPLAAVSIALFFLVGYYRGTNNLTWHIIPILVLIRSGGSSSNSL